MAHAGMIRDDEMEVVEAKNGVKAIIGKPAPKAMSRIPAAKTMPPAGLPPLVPPKTKLAVVEVVPSQA